MPFNYFNVFARANKEMMHSAMLRYLLLAHPILARRLFAHFNYPVGRVELESPHTKEKQRFRIDVEAWSEDEQHILVIENKFKAFPTLRQLEDYDAIYSETNKVSCYLVCFDGNGVPFQKNGIIQTTHHAWHILTYREIYLGIEAYLNEFPTLDQESRIFLSHYVQYLIAYYTRYEQILCNYQKAFTTPEASSQTNQREVDQENRFWQRLALSSVGNNFTLRRREQGVFANECVPDHGGSTTPLLIVFPFHWNGHNALDDDPQKKIPVLSIQVQGDSLKLGIDHLPKDGTDSIREKTFAYAQRLLKALPDSVRATKDKTLNVGATEDKILKNRLWRGNRFITLFRRPLNKDVPVTKVCEQLWQFFQDIDTAVTQAGNFSDH